MVSFFNISYGISSMPQADPQFEFPTIRVIPQERHLNLTLGLLCKEDRSYCSLITICEFLPVLNGCQQSQRFHHSYTVLGSPDAIFQTPRPRHVSRYAPNRSLQSIYLGFYVAQILNLPSKLRWI